MGYGKIKIHRYEEELSYQSDIFITEEMKTVLIEGYGNVSWSLINLIMLDKNWSNVK